MRYFASLFAACLLLTGCAGGNGTLGGVTEPNQPKVVQGGVLTLQMRSIDILNPLLTRQESNRLIYNLVFDSLFEINKELKPTPRLAEEYSFSEEGLLLTLRLRQDVIWHDGRPFTSKDVEHTISQILNSGGKSPYAERLSAISSCVSMGNSTVYIYLKERSFDIIEALDFPIIPAHVGSIESSLVGTGQYRFVQMVAGRSLTLEANKAWALGEPPLIETIHVRLTDNDQDAIAAFTAGEISAVTTDLLPFGSYGVDKNVRTDAYLTNRFEFLGFNAQEPRLSSPGLRRAISFAIDRKRLVNDIYFSHGHDTNAPVHPKGWLHTPDPDEPYYNAETARALLFEDGWADNDGDGVLDKEHLGASDSLNFELLVNEENKGRVGAAELIRDFFEEVGIRIRVKAVPWEEYSRRISAGEYDMFLGAADFSSGLAPFIFFSGGDAEKGPTGYASVGMKMLVSFAKSAMNEEQYKDSIHELQRAFNRDVPAAGICFVDGALLRNISVRGDIEPTAGNAYRGINKWFLAKQD